MQNSFKEESSGLSTFQQKSLTSIYIKSRISNRNSNIILKCKTQYNNLKLQEGQFCLTLQKLSKIV